MKKFTTVLILVIHLWNTGGYIALKQYMAAQSDLRVNELLKENLYDPSQLVEVKIKQQSPKKTEWDDYRNVNGLLQLKNECYNYVKLKITKDTLYVLCMLNYKNTRFTDNNVIYAKNIDTLPLKNQDSTERKSTGDAQYDHPDISFTFLRFAKSIPRKFSNTHAFFTGPLMPVPGQPPEMAV